MHLIQGARHKVAIAATLLLSACSNSSNEDRASRVIGKTVPEPEVIKFRDLRQSDSQPETLCGDFSAKDKVGGKYLGFRPFLIDEDEKLLIIDDTVTKEGIYKFIELCGSREQRQKLALERKVALVDFVDTTAEEAAPSANLRNSPFAPPTTPTTNILSTCHMGACHWIQLTEINPIKDDGKSFLYKVSIRTGESAHGNEDYPETDNPKVDITWKNGTEYVLCSKSRPSVISRFNNSPNLTVIALDPEWTSGANQWASNLYSLVCHGSIKAFSSDTASSFGYSTVETEDQREISSIDQVFQ